jgi:hypothetical protein
LRIILIAALLALAALLWFALVRRVPQESALATIRSKTFREAGTYTQQQVGAQRGFRTPTSIPIAESYVFELRLEGEADPVLASFNTVKSRQFEVNQRVRVDFVRRGFPPFWQRVAVVDMFPVEGP